MADPIEQVERVSILLEKGPIAVVAAFFTLAFFAVAIKLLQAVHKHQLATQRLQTEHQVAMQALQAEHAEEIAQIYREDKERAVKAELAIHSLLELVGDIRFIAFEMKQKKERPPRTASKPGGT